MKFNAVVGNPPYQIDSASQDTEAISWGRVRNVNNIFHLFQICADKISSGYTSLIYPGTRWIYQCGKGMKQFGLNQINDTKLSKLIFYPNAQDIFNDVSIAGGISIVLKDKTKTSDTFEYIYVENNKKTESILNYPGEELLVLNPKNESIVTKVTNYVRSNNLTFLHDRILPRELFDIGSKFAEEHPGTVREYISDNEIDYLTEVKLLNNHKPGTAGRAKWYVTQRNNIPTNVSLIDEWQVIVSSSNPDGQKSSSQLTVIDNHSAFGSSRLALGSFKTKEEATNFYKLMKTDLFRFLLSLTGDSLAPLGKKVPDFGDYTSTNKFINYDKDLNLQLKNIFSLSDSEQEYIENIVKSFPNCC